MAGNPHPFGSDAWKQHNDAEVASRPTARLDRRPLTPEQLESYRPKPAVLAPVNVADVRESLIGILTAHDSVRPQDRPLFIAYLRNIFTKVEALETNPALSGVEKRG
jgi:hypothetical protein